MKPPPPRPHPLARSVRVDQANRFFARAWEKGWFPQPLLEAGALWESAARPLGEAAKAAEHAGRSPEDVADFRERLERLTTAAREEAGLNPLGRVMAHGQLERVIRTRLRMGHAWIDRPGLRATPLAPPILVIGQMRSGTTRIHTLLAADPGHSHTRYCDAFHPVPSARADLRRWKSELEIRVLNALNPWLQSIHPVASGAVEEELGWLAGALQHSIYESQWRIPSYSAWSEARCARAIYREFARTLRTDAAHRGTAHRPRVMKVPAFSENLPELFEQFPDARLIVAERAHGDVLRSAVSLVANQMAVQSDTCDIDAISSEWRRKIAMREERREAALKAWNGPIVRLSFEGLNEDWEREIARCYRELELDLTAVALASMRARMMANQNGHHNAHSAQLAGFARQS